MQGLVHRLMMRGAAVFAITGLVMGLVLPGCATSTKQGLSGKVDEPQGVAPADAAARGGYHRAVTTKSSDAQEWFDRGMFLCFAFDHEQAEIAFRRALEHDPDCAMAYWGIAFSAGPNYNNTMMDEQRSKTASDSIAKAAERQSGCTPVERDLIAAMEKRFQFPPPEDRQKLDEQYAAAMRDVWRKYPSDVDVGAIFAESLMDLYAWKLWSPDGSPSPVTVELVGVLETILRENPSHLGACHEYIHTMEASQTPEKADAAADLLRDHAPGAPHLVHMPSHIDIRCGRYENAVKANQKAIASDRERTRFVGAGGFFALYRAHNYHFLQYAAMFDGQRTVAIEASRAVVESMPAQVVDQYPLMLEGFLGAPYHAMIRFGMWDEILAEPAPGPNRPITTATHHYARGIAHAALGDVKKARQEQEAFLAAFGSIPSDAYIGNNQATAVMSIGRLMLEGEIEYRAGNSQRAFTLLREAVKANDALSYDEPWGWMQPPRHALGALLLEQGDVAEAEEVYVADLEHNPGNGWALLGLAECYERTGRADQHAKTLAAAKKAWARSDIPLTVSCYCRTGNMQASR